MFPPKSPAFPRFSIPSKAFLLGEYSVLAGGSALVATFAPRFFGGEDSSASNPFHPESPAGLFWKQGGFRFEDSTAGGAGASTAQFALACAARARGVPPWREVWDEYRAITQVSPGGAAPSGADLVAQCVGGICHFNPTAKSAEDLWPAMDWSRVAVLSASHQPGRKVRTHEHLREVSPQRIASWNELLAPITAAGLQAARVGDIEGFGRSLDQYAEALSLLELEAKDAREDRTALREIPGVLGAKGSGALQRDLLVVAYRSLSQVRERLSAVVEARGLRVLALGLDHQPGLRLEEAL